MQDRHAYLAELYAGKPMESMKIRYNVPDEAFAYINEQLLKGIESGHQAKRKRFETGHTPYTGKKNKRHRDDSRHDRCRKRL